MPVPIVTFGLVLMRASLRPINKIVVGHFKNANLHPMGFKFFATIGHGTNKVESFLNPHQKAEVFTEEKAFNVGADWFTEMIFFYGTLLGVCYWEFRKFQASQKQLRLRITNLETNSVDIAESLERVKDRQTATRATLQQVFADV